MITMLQRYYLKEFFLLFFIIALGLGFISSMIELVDKIEGFIQYNPPASKLLLYSLLNVPRYLLYLMPVAALLSSLFTFGQAGRRKETVAIKASGGSIKGLLVPFIYCGIFLALAAFLMSEFVAPNFSKKAHRLSDSITKREKILTVKEGTAWLRARDCIVKIDLYLPDKGAIRGVTIMKIEGDMLTDRIEADSGEWGPVLESRGDDGRRYLEGPSSSRPERGVWYLRGVTDYNIKSGTVTKFGEIRSDVIDSPNIIGRGMQKPEEMNARELLSYTKRLRDAGIKNTRLLIDIHSRLSFPLINIIMLLVGVSLATRGEIKSGLITTAMGIFISLLYWLGYTACLSMGYTGILSPVFSAWLVPVIFGGVALYLFVTIPE